MMSFLLGTLLSSVFGKLDKIPLALPFFLSSSYFGMLAHAFFRFLPTHFSCPTNPKNTLCRKPTFICSPRNIHVTPFLLANAFECSMKFSCDTFSSSITLFALHEPFMRHLFLFHHSFRAP